MKKIFALLAVAATTLFSTVQAQLLSGIEGMPPYKLGVTAGLNVPTFSHSGYTSTAGFQLGGSLLLDGSKLVNNTYGRVELKYSMKGAYHEPNVRITSHYIELPIRVGYAYLLDDDWTFIGEIGPYFALGLGGSTKWDGVTAMTDGNGDPVFDNNGNPVFKAATFKSDFFGSDGASRFDFGGGIHVGAIFMKNYQLTLGYDWGFINMSEGINQNRNLQLNFTYYFE